MKQIMLCLLMLTVAGPAMAQWREPGPNALSERQAIESAIASSREARPASSTWMLVSQLSDVRLVCPSECDDMTRDAVIAAVAAFRAALETALGPGDVIEFIYEDCALDEGDDGDMNCRAYAVPLAGMVP